MVGHPQRFKILRRVLAIFSKINFYRSFTVIVTSLPDASPICARQWDDPTGKRKYAPGTCTHLACSGLCCGRAIKEANAIQKTSGVLIVAIELHKLVVQLNLVVANL